MSDASRMILAAGRVVYFHGLPFELVKDTEFSGAPANIDFALNALTIQDQQSNTQAVVDSVNGVSGA